MSLSTKFSGLIMKTSDLILPSLGQVGDEPLFLHMAITAILQKTQLQCHFKTPKSPATKQPYRKCCRVTHLHFLYSVSAVHSHYSKIKRLPHLFVVNLVPVHSCGIMKYSPGTANSSYRAGVFKQGSKRTHYYIKCQAKLST